MSDREKARERIRLMIPRTEARGCSPDEADSAARMIGKLIMKFPDLIDNLEDRMNRPRPAPSPKPPRSKYVTIRHNGILRKSPSAMLVNIKGHEYWIPNSQVSSIDAIYVTMTSWIAEAKGII